MKTRYFYVVVLMSCYILSCNSTHKNNELRKEKFENECGYKFPVGIEVIEYNEDIESDTYLLHTKLKKSTIETFIDQNKQFRVFNDSIIGGGINFSQDNLDLSEFEVLFELKKMSIPRDNSIYILKNRVEFGKNISILNIDSGMLLSIIEN